MVKAWIYNRVPQAYPHNVEVKFIGGDPRVVFASRIEEFCYNEQGELLSIEAPEDISQEEIKLNGMSEEQIE
jgi:hypothetical protein